MITTSKPTVLEILDKTTTSQTIKTKKLTLKQKIAKNYYKCDDSEWIRADNAKCLAKTQVVAQNTPTVARNSSYTPSYSTTGNTYSPGYCTWGVKNWVSWIPNGWGSGYEWPSSAQANGFTVSLTPTVGSVASSRLINHVAVVVAVGTGTVTVKEMNYSGLYSVNTRTTPITDWQYIRP